MNINWKHQALLGLRVEKNTTKSHPTCAGLRLRLYANGRKVWEWNRTAKKRRLRTTLGQFPTMGMAVAEERARELNAEFDLGFDPLAKPEPLPEPAPREKVEETWTLYIRDCIRRRRKSVHVRDLAGRKYLVAMLGMKSIREVTTADIQQVVDAPLSSQWKGCTGGAVRSNAILKICKTFFRFCVKREIDGIQRNPADAIDPIPTASIQGSRPKRWLSMRELALIVLAGRELDRRNGGKTAWADILTLLVMNGCRKGEVFEAFGDEWDRSRRSWVIGASRYKTSAECILPLGPTSAAIMDRRAERGAYIIPNQPGVRTGAYVYFRDKITAIMEEIGGEPIEHWSFHDIRYGFRTNIRDLGITDKEGAEDIIHPSPSQDIADRYDLARLKRMGEALTKWDWRVNEEIAIVMGSAIQA